MLSELLPAAHIRGSIYMARHHEKRATLEHPPVTMTKEHDGKKM
jgi:hypothetical protein